MEGGCTTRRVAWTLPCRVQVYGIRRVVSPRAVVYDGGVTVIDNDVPLNIVQTSVYREKIDVQRRGGLRCRLCPDGEGVLAQAEGWRLVEQHVGGGGVFICDGYITSRIEGLGSPLVDRKAGTGQAMMSHPEFGLYIVTTLLNFSLSIVPFGLFVYW